jgi:hypothetical protein
MDIEYNKLNDDWINNFEKTDKLYQEFYKDDIYYINLKFIYVNRSNEIEKIKQESFLMNTPNIISREEILQILKRSINKDDRLYSLLAILKYNCHLDADDVKHFLLYPNEYNHFLTVVKHIDTIKFDRTISMLQDLNDLVLIFYEKSNELKQINPHTSTKKIYLHSKNKKTIKKRYKE